MARKAKDQAAPTKDEAQAVADDMLKTYEDLAAGPSDIPDALDDPDWVRSTGKTPIEFLTAVYRHPLPLLRDRITAAKTVVEYTSRTMPSALELTGLNGGPLKVSSAMLSALSDAELADLEALLAKAARGSAA